MYAAILVLAALSLPALPAMAQSLGGYAQYCRNAGGRLVCGPATASTGTRPYERWDNGTSAQASGSSSAYRYRPDPLSLGRPNTLYGFGK
jgi:hypothetical protein